MSSPKVAAVVLNWNRVDDTLRCVASLRQSDYPNLEVLVVDNGSTPEAYAQLQAALRPAELLRSEVNLGFARGNNLGLGRVLQGGADYALVINNDTTVDTQMVGQLVGAAEGQPSVGLLGPIIYYMDRPSEVWFAGYRFDHGIYLLRRGLHLTAPLRPVEEVDFVSGAGMLIRRSVLEQGLLFPEMYFMYYEDLDLCFRVKAAGFGIACVTGARMWHAVSASTGGVDSPIKQYYQVKSSLIFYRQHSRGWKLVLNVALRLAHAGWTLAKAVLTGRLKIAALPMFMKGLREGWGSKTATAAAPAAPVESAAVERCPVCGGREWTALFEGSDRLFDLPGRFPVVRCDVCGAAYLRRRPADLAPYYPAERYSAYSGSGGEARRSTGRRLGLEPRRKLLQSLAPEGGALLDVGCGSGDFLAVMQGTPGWRVVGIEPDRGAAEYARRERGLDVRQGQLPQPDLEGAQFDIITLWHVLEHTPQPQETLAEVRRLLKRDGRLIVAVPAADSWEARAFGRNWAGYDVPRHMVTFTRPSLEGLLARGGFESKEQTGIIRGLASLQLSLAWRLQAGSPFGARALLASALLPWAYLWMRLRDGNRAGVAVYVARPICEDE